MCKAQLPAEPDIPLRRDMAHYICAFLSGPCDDTCLQIADALIEAGFGRVDEPVEPLTPKQEKALRDLGPEPMPPDQSPKDWQETLADEASYYDGE